MNRFVILLTLFCMLYIPVAGRADAIHFAIEHNNLPLVKSLVNGDPVQLEAMDSDRWTPLAYAARFGRLEIARFLLEKGAKVDSTDRQGYTPLHQAAAFGHVELIHLLIDKGAQVNRKTTGGVTPRRLAKSNGHTRAVNALEDRGGI